MYYPPKFSVCLFVLSVLFVTFFLVPYGRSPSVHYWISIRYCHRSRLTTFQSDLCVKSDEISIPSDVLPPRFSVCLCLFWLLCFFLVPYGRTKSVHPTIEISIRLCHRSRLICLCLCSWHIFLARTSVRTGQTYLTVCDWTETKQNNWNFLSIRVFWHFTLIFPF
jgi:hypothetical protein